MALMIFLRTHLPAQRDLSRTDAKCPPHHLDIPPPVPHVRLRTHNDSGAHHAI